MQFILDNILLIAVAFVSGGMLSGRCCAIALGGPSLTTLQATRLIERQARAGDRPAQRRSPKVRCPTRATFRSIRFPGASTSSRRTARSCSSAATGCPPARRRPSCARPASPRYSPSTAASPRGAKRACRWVPRAPGARHELFGWSVREQSHEQGADVQHGGVPVLRPGRGAAQGAWRQGDREGPRRPRSCAAPRDDFEDEARYGAADLHRRDARRRLRRPVRSRPRRQAAALLAA